MKLKRHDPRTEDALIAYLLQFVTPEKQARMAEVIQNRTRHVRVVLEDIYQPHNASAVIRSCECFGIQHLHVIENKYKFRINPDVAMGGGKWIHIHRHRTKGADNTRECLRELRQAGYRIAATSLSPDSTPLPELDLDQPVALCFGTEEVGLGDTILREADLQVHIPMLGFTQSFNISVSVALCLYELRNRMEREGIPAGLSAGESREVYRRWLRATLKNCEILERTYLKGLQTGS